MASSPLGLPYLRPEQAAAMLGVQTRTLSRWRSEGDGPRYFKFGRQVRYSTDDLNVWIASKAIIPPRSGDAAY